MKFVYVFSERERDVLLKAGFPLVSANERGHIYVFRNSRQMNFSASGIQCVFSDTLTF